MGEEEKGKEKEKRGKGEVVIRLGIEEEEKRSILGSEGLKKNGKDGGKEIS